ncbi:MAG TPA: hypothetical protein VGY98_03650 [Verrucomicrobiae bacterium]|nr:hypothetical protein [Verrucomicrobiae bacterium]
MAATDDVNTKYIISITAILAVIHCLFAGSALPAPQARVAPQAPVAAAPIAPTAGSAPVGGMNTAPVAPLAPIANSPIAPLAPVAPAPAQSLNPNFQVYPNGSTYGSNGAYFPNGVPAAYFRNTNSISWATNPPYGNPVLGYTNNTIRTMVPYQGIAPVTNSLPQFQQ